MRALNLESGPLDAAAQMALDEAALESAAPDSFLLRFYQWAVGPDGFPLTFGISMAYEDAAAAAREQSGLFAAPFVRRATGGGIVFHDGDLTFSVIFPWGRLISPGVIYKEIHLAAHLGLKSRGVETRLWAPPSSGENLPGFKTRCFSGAEPKDLVLPNGEKILGGALRRRAGMGLYQGSLRPEKLGLSAAEIRGALLEGISLLKKLLFRPEGVSAAVRERAAVLAAEKYSSERWNMRR